MSSLIRLVSQHLRNRSVFLWRGSRERGASAGCYVAEQDPHQEAQTTLMALLNSQKVNGTNQTQKGLEFVENVTYFLLKKKNTSNKKGNI